IRACRLATCSATLHAMLLWATVPAGEYIATVLGAQGQIASRRVATPLHANLLVMPSNLDFTKDAFCVDPGLVARPCRLRPHLAGPSMPACASSGSSRRLLEAGIALSALASGVVPATGAEGRPNRRVVCGPGAHHLPRRIRLDLRAPGHGLSARS